MSERLIDGDIEHVVANTVELKKMLFRLERQIAPHLLEGKTEAVFDRVRQSLIVGVEGFLLGEELKPVVISYPTDWWQAFKQRWLPAWAKERWPVRETTHTISFSVVYPDFKPQLPKQRHFIQFSHRNFDTVSR